MSSYSTNNEALIRTIYASVDREAIVRRSEGVIAETYPRRLNVATLTAVSGSVYFNAVGLIGGDVITNLSMNVGTAGVGVTLSKVAIYSKAGVLLASSADQGTSWQAVGLKTIALSAVYVVPTTDVYYLAVIAVFSSALTFARGGFFPLEIDKAVGSGTQPFGIQTAQSDLPAPATIITGSTGAGGTSSGLWLAAS